MQKEKKRKTVRKRKATEEYWCFFDQCHKPVSDKIINHIADDLIRWARDDDEAFKLSQFWVKRGIDRKTFYRFLKRSKTLEAARDFALQCISNRREVGAIMGKYPEKTVMPYMAMFDPDHKAFVQWKNDLKKELDGAKSSQQVIVIEKAPDSPLVPPKDCDDHE